MPSNTPRTPTDMPKTFNVTPITTKSSKRKPGRPPVVDPNPPMPDFEMPDAEKELYEYFIRAVEADYPGLRPSDRLLLPLAAATYIQCLRVTQYELAKGEQLSMARQHPATFFARYMDQLLGTTRKNRVRQGEKDKDDDVDFSKLYAS